MIGLRFAGLVLIGILLLAPAAQSEASAPPADSLTAAAVAVQLRYGPVEASARSPAPRRRSLGTDKIKHVFATGLWTLSTQYVLVNKAGWTETDALPASIASGATVGILKELYDASSYTGEASVGDLVADAVGIGLAVGVISL